MYDKANNNDEMCQDTYKNMKQIKNELLEKTHDNFELKKDVIRGKTAKGIINNHGLDCSGFSLVDGSIKKKFTELKRIQKYKDKANLNIKPTNNNIHKYNSLIFQMGSIRNGCNSNGEYSLPKNSRKIGHSSVENIADITVSGGTGGIVGYQDEYSKSLFNRSNETVTNNRIRIKNFPNQKNKYQKVNYGNITGVCSKKSNTNNGVMISSQRRMLRDSSLSVYDNDKSVNDIQEFYQRNGNIPISRETQNLISMKMK